MEQFSDLLNKTLSNVENINNEMIVFTLDTGEKYKLYHDQDCCESVLVDDIIGDLSDLIGSPIRMAEEVSQTNTPLDGIDNSGVHGGHTYEDESFTWTFYKLATIKGYVTIRWYGVSNGYYSESVSWGVA